MGSSLTVVGLRHASSDFEARWAWAEGIAAVLGGGDALRERVIATRASARGHKRCDWHPDKADNPKAALVIRLASDAVLPLDRDAVVGALSDLGLDADWTGDLVEAAEKDEATATEAAHKMLEREISRLTGDDDLTATVDRAKEARYRLSVLRDADKFLNRRRP